MIANYATAAGSSSIITVAIFYVMQSLITMQPGIVVDSREPHVVSFLRKQWPEDPPLVDIKPIPRPTVVNLPEIHSRRNAKRIKTNINRSTIFKERHIL